MTNEGMLTEFAERPEYELPKTFRTRLLRRGTNATAFSTATCWPPTGGIQVSRLRSCYRMGYKDSGSIYVARLLNRYLHSSAGRRPYRFRLEWVTGCRCGGGSRLFLVHHRNLRRASRALRDRRSENEPIGQECYAPQFFDLASYGVREPRRRCLQTPPSTSARSCRRRRHQSGPWIRLAGWILRLAREPLLVGVREMGAATAPGSRLDPWALGGARASARLGPGLLAILNPPRGHVG